MKKYSPSWFADQGYRDGRSGNRHRRPHDGMIDRLIGISPESRRKRNAYNGSYTRGSDRRRRGN